MRLAAGLCSDPLGSSHRSPRPLAEIWGGRGREGEQEKGKGRGKEVRGREGRGERKVREGERGEGMGLQPTAPNLEACTRLCAQCSKVVRQVES